ncbi:hypothetical protein Y032_0001g93 [Ancylostoma ceylanicum]|uniref:Uncharacterized protein n=1 Tax=Ancylostoma ceylanicum TaxID=53326 RepID=A0A016W518_9BILA|nr:hypothetical protein Y032_0001g93 [Ancylostoma ceylanicum]
MITIHGLLPLHFVLTLTETPHLRQEMKMWMDELYWIAKWIKTNGNGYIPAAFFPPRPNVLDTAPEFLPTVRSSNTKAREVSPAVWQMSNMIKITTQ